jgi:hypothetical protein
MKGLPMAKSKTKIPKKVVGVKVPKALRKSAWLDTLLAAPFNSDEGRGSAQVACS